MIQKVNLGEKLSQFSEYYSPKIVGEINDAHVKVVKLQGEFVWHHHDNEDELFMVMHGRFRMEFRDENNTDQQTWIEEGEMIIVPRGVDHRPVAEEECHVLLFEPVSTLNTGEKDNEFTRKTLDAI